MLETTETVPSSGYRFERDLVVSLTEHLRAQLASRRTLATTLRHEVPVGRAIADIVSVSAPRARLARRHAVGLAFTVSESVALARLRRHGPTRVDRLPAVCGLTPRELKQGVWAQLVESKIIRQGPGGRITLAPLWPSTLQVVAIEAKLTRWRDALRQAIEYRRFADRVYVAISETHIAAALRSRDEFEHPGVGLLAVNGAVRTIVPAKPSTDHDWRREFVVSRLLDSSFRGASVD